MTRKMGDMPYTVVDDELYAELAELAGQKVVHIQVWEDALLDELAAEPPAAAQDSFDMDLYLEDGVYFELYSAACHLNPEGEALAGWETVQRLLLDRVRRGLWLLEVAVDEGGALALVLGDPSANPSGQAARLYLAIAGWLIEQWDELPEA
jgi:hypothetical protein